MPFDGKGRDWEPKPPFAPWYTIRATGRKNGRKHWQLDVLWPGSCEGNWWPVASFYARTSCAAWGIASGIVRTFGEVM